MSVRIERRVWMQLVCACGEIVYNYKPTRKECLADFAGLGWEVKLHRKGESTAACPRCVDSAADEKEQRKAALAAIRSKKKAALAKYKADMAELRDPDGAVQEQEE